MYASYLNLPLDYVQLAIFVCLFLGGTPCLTSAWDIDLTCVSAVPCAILGTCLS